MLVKSVMGVHECSRQEGRWGLGGCHMQTALHAHVYGAPCHTQSYDCIPLGHILYFPADYFMTMCIKGFNRAITWNRSGFAGGMNLNVYVGRYIAAIASTTQRRININLNL